MPKYVISFEEFVKRIDAINVLHGSSLMVKAQRGRRVAREAMGVSVEELAALIGVGKDLLYKWERGDRHPSQGQLNKWEAALDALGRQCDAAEPQEAVDIQRYL